MAAQSKTSRLVRSFRSEGSADLTPRVTMNVTHVHFETPANGKSVEASLAEFFGGQLPPPGIGRAAAAYGLNTTIGNALGNLEGDELNDPDEIMEAIRDRIETLKKGQWASDRVGGGRPSIVKMAFFDWRKSKGVKDSDEKIASLTAQWFEDETNFKKLQANPEFAVYLAQFKASRKKPEAGAAAADLLA